ncbi:spermatogenesis- and oogenesis-specific basic helix-loop-helix-containing protein 2 isoform X5 [Canis lupus familiaris]|uniref:spermatogenesis- and oogenesis-specific basic helix-loop-helix-containing protein 2 isoform X5 n=1 Tax=Canis lupus familiaris TaxID=9615 RepID=UPI000BAA1226|nr:spermatogenesis- and oogenesis-specific basic helix-loop-helix-containing protein 2 isoform X5 [Canis lupus familiaris]XP_038290774.1 spermatogenesis- and oogenesis-specific basic helix-loop-helix-containing protein 2 isoform X5 [Canis lupus familiaris]XP_038429202.1 spermatogenesis- and oogenesis-specific basic helix-loop-helix-containing protein 2 isoform X5 [Canis lupus familiaris]|eukprot:XP_022265632.1 spermatogenesis- and oogenesis-specific basic helix-loop-helix-containing protein 2 isoform X5 [Canis lupus familiaris]
MAALISCPERGQVSGQAKIDLLLVGDVTVQYLADIAQKSFSNIAKVTITMRDVEQAAVLLENCPFDVVFLKMTSLPTAEELEAVELISSEALRNDIGLELKAPVPNSEKSKKISLLHSSKEKLRRERIKYCCEQLRTLLPYIKGRKNDTASILEATVDYVKYIREKIPPAIMGQITEVLQSNRRFCKKQQMSIQLSFPGTIMAQRENGVLTSTYSPMRGIRFLANKCLNVYSVPASGGSLDEPVRGQSSSTSENAIGDMYKTRIPSKALSLNSFHAVRYYSKVIPSYDAAAITNQNISVHFPSAVPKVSKFLPQHCNSVLGQTCTTHPNCLKPQNLILAFLHQIGRSSSLLQGVSCKATHTIAFLSQASGKIPDSFISTSIPCEQSI